jgi:RHS repeat-associated protein
VTTTSADPVALGGFVDGTVPSRTGLETTLWSLTMFASGVESRCEYRRVESSGGVLASAKTMFEAQATNERFVTEVRDALVAADGYSGGVATVDSTAVLAELNAAGLTAPPGVVLAPPTSLVGQPPTSGLVDDPVCAANGNFVHDEMDLSFPGFAGAMALVRTYNSMMFERVGAFGAGWSSVLDVAVTSDELGVRLTLPDGAEVWFASIGDQLFEAIGARRFSMIRDADGWLAVRGSVARQRMELRFDVAGRLVSFVREERAVTVDRDVDGRVTRLRDDRSGRWVSFSWDDGVVVAATTDDGRSVRYRYDGRLLVAVEGNGADMIYAHTDGVLTTITDADGVVLVSNVYDAAGRVMSQTSRLGRVTHYEYSPSTGGGGSTVTVDPLTGVRNAFVHDRWGNLTAMIDGHGAVQRMRYDDRHRVVALTDRVGATWTYRFDDADRLVERVDPDGLAMGWEWDALGRVTAEIDRAGGVTRFSYEGSWTQPVRVEGPDGSVATCELVDGVAVAYVDPDGVRMAVELTEAGVATAAIDPLGNTTRLRYDGAGRVVGAVDAVGTETTLDCDALGRVVRTTTAESVAEYAYSAAGRAVGGVEPGGVGWSATFDARGAFATFTDAMGSTVAFEHDSCGNVIAITAPDGAVFRQEFDALNQMTAFVDPTGARCEQRFDAEGRCIAAIAADGATWSRTVDWAGRTVTSVDPVGRTVTYGYHPNGEMSSLTLPDGRVWSTEIDAAGRVVTVVDPAGGRWTTAYSPAGRVVERRTPAGRRETYRYDAAGRCVSHTDLDGVATDVTLDGRGRIVTVTRGDDRAAVARDGRGFPTQITDLFGATTIERDDAGRPVRSVDAGGVTRTFEWDARGLLTGAATVGVGGGDRYRYDPRGLLASHTKAAGTSTSYCYDPVGRVTSMVDELTGTTSFTRDPRGRIAASITEGFGATFRLGPTGSVVARTAPDGSLRSDFSFDSTGRTAAATGAAGEWTTAWDALDQLAAVGTPEERREFARDADGRLDLSAADVPAVERDAAGRITVGSDGTRYTYDLAGRLASHTAPGGTATVYGYDDLGRLVSEGDASGRREFSYDALGRLTSFVHGTRRGEFAYDTSGRRTGETWSDGMRRTFRWDGYGQLAAIETTVGDTIAVATITRDPYGRIHRVDDTTIGWDTGATGRVDRIGRARFEPSRIVDRTGHPYGAPASGVTVGLHDHLAVDGFVDIGARTYDTITRHFLSPDPLPPVPGSVASVDAYALCDYDPVNRLDPTGLRPISQAEYDEMRRKQEQGLLGQAWEAIKEDPWGSLAMGAVLVAGVALCATGFGAVGGGILIGMAITGGIGLATGNFDPRQVAIGGLVGAIPGGGTVTTAIRNGAIAGGVGETANQAVSGNGFDVGNIVQQTVIGGATGGVTQRLLGNTGDDWNRLITGDRAVSAPVRNVAAETDRLAARVNDFHSMLDPIAQNGRTTTVMSTREGFDVVASGGRDLSPAQRALARDGDVLGHLPRTHAEVTALDAAQKANLTPSQIEVSRPICADCQTAIRETGGEITPSELGAVWPR